MDDLKNKSIFGKVISYINVIEFQKRGLPHAHILIILDEKDKFKTTDDYDRVVSAEFPDHNKNPTAYQTITKFNIHGPCGS